MAIIRLVWQILNYNLLENLTVVSKIKQLSSIIWKIIPSRCNIDIILHSIYIFRHRIIIFNKESKGAAFGRAPQGRGAPLWLLSLLNMIILCLHIWILCIIISILRLFGMIFQIMKIITYLSLLRPCQGAREIYHPSGTQTHVGPCPRANH